MFRGYGPCGWWSSVASLNPEPSCSVSVCFICKLAAHKAEFSSCIWVHYDSNSNLSGGFAGLCCWHKIVVGAQLFKLECTNKHYYTIQTLAPLLRTTLALNVKVTSDEAGLRRTAPSELHCINVWVSQRSHPDYARRQVPYTHVRWIMAQVSFLIMWQTGSRAARMKVESDSGSAAKCSGCFRATSAVWNADTSEAHTPCDGRLCWGRWAG